MPGDGIAIGVAFGEADGVTVVGHTEGSILGGVLVRLTVDAVG